jgi:hypothetical protein
MMEILTHILYSLITGGIFTLCYRNRRAFKSWHGLLFFSAIFGWTWFASKIGFLEHKAFLLVLLLIICLFFFSFINMMINSLKWLHRRNQTMQETVSKFYLFYDYLMIIVALGIFGWTIWGTPNG